MLIYGIVWSVCVCLLTGKDRQGDGGLGQDGPGSKILSVAHIVVSAVALLNVGEVEVPVEADHHSLVLLDVDHP